MYTGKKVWIVKMIEPEVSHCREEKDSWFDGLCDSLLDGAIELASSLKGNISIGPDGIKFSLGLKDN